jgi:hypothetical protein
MVTDSGPEPPPAGGPQRDEKPGEPREPAEEAEGGETACWAHLVCPECGAMTTEGHRPSCTFASRGAG